MFPDFREYLADEVTNADSLLTKIPFVTTALNQVLQFANAFDDKIYSKINFNLPRVDLKSGTNGSITSGSKTFTAPDAGFTSGLKSKFLSFLDDNGKIVATFAIKTVTNGTTLQLQTAAGANFTNRPFVVHEKLEKVQTLQQLTTAVNSSGILPGGVQITFDPVSQVFSIPLTFSESFTPVDAAIDLGFDTDAISLGTTANGSINASVNGGLALFVDLDGQVFDGVGGNGCSGAEAVSVEQLHIHHEDGRLRTEARRRDLRDRQRSSNCAPSARSIAARRPAHSNATFKVREGLTLGIADAQLDGSVALDCHGSDRHRADRLPGTDGRRSWLRFGHSRRRGGRDRARSQHRHERSGAKRDSRFGDIFDGTATNNLRLDFRGGCVRPDSRAVGQRRHRWRPADRVDSAEVGIYVQDLLNIGSVKTVFTDPSLPFSLAAARAAGTVTATDVVVALPDLSTAFDFSDITFEDIIVGIRSGTRLPGRVAGQRAVLQRDVAGHQPLAGGSLRLRRPIRGPRRRGCRQSGCRDSGGRKHHRDRAGHQRQQQPRSAGPEVLVAAARQHARHARRVRRGLLGHVPVQRRSGDADSGDRHRRATERSARRQRQHSAGCVRESDGRCRHSIRRRRRHADLPVRLPSDSRSHDDRQRARCSRIPVSRPAAAKSPSRCTNRSKSQLLAAKIAAASTGQPSGSTLKSIRANVVSAIDDSLGATANTDTVHGAGQLLGTSASRARRAAKPVEDGPWTSMSCCSRDSKCRRPTRRRWRKSMPSRTCN